MSRIYSHIRLKRKLREKLIGSGADGISQHQLMQQCRTRLFKIADIEEILEDWRGKDWVQKFYTTQSHSKKPVIIWRATQLIVLARF